MWNSDSRQWSSSSGYQGNRDWGKSKQDWSDSTNSWWDSRKDSTLTPTVAAAEPTIPSHFQSDDKFFDSTAVGSGIISFIVWFNPQIGPERPKSQADQLMIFVCMSCVFVG